MNKKYEHVYNELKNIEYVEARSVGMTFLTLAVSVMCTGFRDYSTT